jgi:hypothetical protein
VTNRTFRLAAVIICLLLLVPAALTACRNPGYIYNADGAVECGGDGHPIVLTRNPNAADPTFDQLVAFIEQDPTDLNPYIDGKYVCADFAADVYNHAEAAGIRAGWVGITFENASVGHAVDAFETTDRGLVYIDCTNGASSDPQSRTSGWDMVAYLEVGRQYGVIPLDQVIATGQDFYPLTYDYYTQREAAWQNYAAELDSFNSSVTAFNTATGGHTFIIGSAEYARVSDWKDQLQAQQKDLQDYQAKYGQDWYESEYSSYTVKDIAIHW